MSPAFEPLFHTNGATVLWSIVLLPIAKVVCATSVIMGSRFAILPFIHCYHMKHFVFKFIDVFLQTR